MFQVMFLCSYISQVDRLKAELIYERRTSEEHLSRFEEERRVWQEEKEKVQTGGIGLIFFQWSAFYPASIVTSPSPSR